MTCDKQSSYYDYLNKCPVTKEQVDSEDLPEGYYYVENSGSWSVYSPDGTPVSINEESKSSAKKRAIQLIKYIENI